MELDRIVRELIDDSKNGIKFSRDCEFPGFYTRVNGINNFSDDKFPVIEIPDYDYFLELLKEYIDLAYVFYDDDKDFKYFKNDEEYVKQLILGLFLSAGRYDLLNVNEYIKRRIKMFNKPSFKEIETKYNDICIRCIVRKNTYMLETPYKFLIILNKEGNMEKFVLPTLNFAIIDDVAHIYAIQNTSRGKPSGEMSKKFDRYFRKVNKGVDQNDDISNITHTALVSLTLFASYLKSIGIKEIVSLDYMPIRYSYREELTSTFKNKDTLLEIMDRDQYNITNKFMNLMNRYNYHFYSKDAYYDDINGEMHLYLNGKENDDNNIINEIDKIFLNKQNKNTHR